MRPSTRILIGGICILVSALYPLVPGIQGNPSWQMPMGILSVIGLVMLYFGCLRAARLAEKAHFASRRAAYTTRPNDDTSTPDAG
jgi:Na+/melibiose symporter-like transporter